MPEVKFGIPYKISNPCFLYICTRKYIAEIRFYPNVVAFSIIENAYVILIKLGHPWLPMVVKDKNRFNHFDV